MTIEWDNDNRMGQWHRMGQWQLLGTMSIAWDNVNRSGEKKSICCAEVTAVVFTAEYCSDGSAAAKSPF